MQAYRGEFLDGTIPIVVSSLKEPNALQVNLLDLTPLGRQEDWEDSPAGWPQTPPYLWWRKHDEYAAQRLAVG